MSYIEREDQMLNLLKTGLAKLRGTISNNPLVSVGLSAAVTYYSAQYGPAIRTGIRFIAPTVGLKCE